MQNVFHQLILFRFGQCLNIWQDAYRDTALDAETMGSYGTVTLCEILLPVLEAFILMPEFLDLCFGFCAFLLEFLDFLCM